MIGRGVLGRKPLLGGLRFYLKLKLGERNLYPEDIIYRGKNAGAKGVDVKASGPNVLQITAVLDTKKQTFSSNGKESFSETGGKGREGRHDKRKKQNHYHGEKKDPKGSYIWRFWDRGRLFATLGGLIERESKKKRKCIIKRKRGGGEPKIQVGNSDKINPGKEKAHFGERRVAHHGQKDCT